MLRRTLVLALMLGCARKKQETRTRPRSLARELVSLAMRAEKTPATRPVATARFREIVESVGWPSRALAGEDGSRAAFFLAIRSNDAALLARCAALAEPCLKRGEESPERYAQLIDRARILAGKRQLYGTQLRKSVDGTVSPYAIEDEANLATRRAAIGLRP